MRRTFAVAILLLTACGSASDEKVGTTARGVPAKGSVQVQASPGNVIVWGGSETAPHDLDADTATCGEEAAGNLVRWTDCMYKKGWRLEDG